MLYPKVGPAGNDTVIYYTHKKSNKCSTAFSKDSKKVTYIKLHFEGMFPAWLPYSPFVGTMVEYLMPTYLRNKS